MIRVCTYIVYLKNKDHERGGVDTRFTRVAQEGASLHCKGDIVLGAQCCALKCFCFLHASAKCNAIVTCREGPHPELLHNLQLHAACSNFRAQQEELRKRISLHMEGV